MESGNAGVGSEWETGVEDLHLAYAFVDRCVGWQGGYFAGCQLQHADFALLEADL